MLQETGECRPCIAQLIDAHRELEQYRLTATDWDVLDATKKFLEPFYDLTLKLEKADVTLDYMQDSMEAIIMHYRESETRHAGNTGLLAAINTSWHSFNTWHEKLDDSPYYAAAILLHPSKRLEGLRTMWKSYTGAATKGVARVKAMWQVYKETRTPLKPTPAAPTKEPSLWERYGRKMNVVPDKDDFLAFINTKPTKIGDDKTPLQWWASMRDTWLALSALAIDVLTPFSQSAVSEGTFSGTRRTIPWERATIGGGLVEQTECCYDWQVSGLAYITQYAVVDSDDDGDWEMESQPSSSDSTA